MEDNGMTREELISLTIDKYTDLQRIKKSNGGVENKELDYQIKVTLAKLSSLGLSGRIQVGSILHLNGSLSVAHTLYRLSLFCHNPGGSLYIFACRLLQRLQNLILLFYSHLFDISCFGFHFTAMYIGSFPFFLIQTEFNLCTAACGWCYGFFAGCVVLHA